MKNPDDNQDQYIPDDEIRSSANPDRDMTGNWDEKAHMSSNIEKNIQHNERRNLNPDREKRNNSNLSPDRNSGDR